MKDSEKKVSSQGPNFETEEIGDIHEDGFIKLHRAWKRSQLFRNPNLWQVWSWCLMEASIIDRWVSVKIGKGSTQVFLRRGQFIYRRDSASKELSMPSSTVEGQIQKCMYIGLIDRKSDNQYSIITVRNFNDYQGDSIRLPTTKGQPKDNQNEIYSIKKNGEECKKKKENTCVEPARPVSSSSFSHKEGKGKNKMKDGIPYQEIIDYLNQLAGKNFKADTKTTVELINDRWDEGYHLKDFQRIIRNKVAQWLEDERLEKYLRPKTLFAADNFESYVNERDNFIEEDSADKIIREVENITRKRGEPPAEA
jgi:uncharacterized phage protein (TIGR02220 family)